MPPRKERKLIEFDFFYKGSDYKFNGYQITDTAGLYICDCDITAYKMDYTEDNLGVCCKIVLDFLYLCDGISEYAVR